MDTNNLLQSNQRQRSLFLILIFTLVASGITLALLSQIQNYEHEQTSFTPLEVLLKQKNKQQANPLPTQVENINIENWKVYRNKEYGFEIRYPENWQQSVNGIEDPNHFFSFLPKDQIGKDYPDPSYEIVVEDVKNKIFEDWFNDRYVAHANKPTKSLINFNNTINAWKINDPETIGGCASEYIMVYQPSFVVILPDPVCENSPIITAISASIKFTK